MDEDAETKPGLALGQIAGGTPPVGIERDAITRRGLQIIQQLGRGGMGTVFLARDLDLDRLVAVKTLSPALARDRTRAELFRSEAAMLARVRSAWVVGVHAFGVRDGLPYFVMEHVDGASLRALLEEHRGRGARLPLARALAILRQVAQGLGDLHQHGVVHRDVKPENVVIERGTGRPVLVDLGLGATAHLDDGLRQIGTLQYMAPEILTAGREHRAVPTQDVYAFGCLLYEVLTGRPMYDDASGDVIARAHVHAPIPRLAADSALLAPLDPLLAALCAKDPASRPRDGHVVARLLMEASQGVREDHSAHSAGDRKVERLAGGAVRILVVEDDEAIRRFLARSVKVGLYGTRTEVIGARDAAEAKAAFLPGAPHLLVLDHGLPGADGHAVLEGLRAREGGADMRVVVVSANLSDDVRRGYDALRADVVLAKPVAFDRLVHAVASLASTAGWAAQEG